MAAENAASTESLKLLPENWCQEYEKMVQGKQSDDQAIDGKEKSCKFDEGETMFTSKLNVEGVVVLDSGNSGCCGIRLGEWVLVPAWPLPALGPFIVLLPRPRPATLYASTICDSLVTLVSVFPWLNERITGEILLLRLGENFGAEEPSKETDEAGDALRLLPTSPVPPPRGVPVLVESTPFLNTALFNSWNKGTVSNLLGGILVIDVPLTRGSEGAPVFRLNGNERTCMGMIVCTIGSMRGETLNLCLAIELHALLSPFIRFPTRNADDILELTHDNFEGSEGIVLVKCGYSRGTGCLIEAVGEIGYILTCAHVVNFGNINGLEISIHFDGESSEASLIYSATKDSLYDVAVLSVGKINTKPMRIASKPPIKGENVLAIGHCFFHEDELPTTPTITRGIIAKIHSFFEPIQTTCAVYHGSSGGAIVRSNRELLGIISFTVVDVNSKIAYPRISYFIPMTVISEPLQKYIKTRDVSFLNELGKNKQELKCMCKDLVCRL